MAKENPFWQRFGQPPLPVSPVNVDAAINNTRPPMGGIYWAEPAPPIYGALSARMPLQDVFIYAGAFRERPFGPGTTTLPRNLQWQSTVPGLNKYTF